MTGTFRAASGWTGTFAGSYRLDRLLTQYGQIVAVGVFTGELVTDDGRSLGVGSRRHTAAAELTSTADAFHMEIRPVELTLLDCTVIFDVITVTMPHDRPQPRGFPRRLSATASRRAPGD